MSLVLLMTSLRPHSAQTRSHMRVGVMMCLCVVSVLCILVALVMEWKKEVFVLRQKCTHSQCQRAELVCSVCILYLLQSLLYVRGQLPVSAVLAGLFLCPSIEVLCSFFFIFIFIFILILFFIFYFLFLFFILFYFFFCLCERFFWEQMNGNASSNRKNRKREESCASVLLFYFFIFCDFIHMCVQKAVLCGSCVQKEPHGHS